MLAKVPVQPNPETHPVYKIPNGRESRTKWTKHLSYQTEDKDIQGPDLI